MVNPKFKEGDRVIRRKDVYDDKSEIMHGTVVKRYSDYLSYYGPYRELYEVRWDNGMLRKAYLPHGLDKE